MYISDKAWDKYISLLRKVNEKAAEEMFSYLAHHNWWTSRAEKQAAIDYAYGLATKYGEAAGAAVCEFYDEVAEEWAGRIVAPAVPAKTATYGEVAKAVNGTGKTLNTKMMSEAIGRLVKMAGVDTMMQNALRDGAEWAWIPNGDTCPFCLTLASRGWQEASEKAIRNGHAEHIHANCDCTYAVRFSQDQNVEGYDPEEYQELYYSAEGNTPEEKINSMRRIKYGMDKDRINAQKRAAYAKRNRKDNMVADINDSFTKISVSAEGTANRDTIGRFNNLPVDYQKRLEALDTILNDYCKKDSLWNKILHIVSGENLKDAWGRSDPDFSITLRNDAKTKTFIHELLHFRSSKHYEHSLYTLHRHLEEGSVELFAEELCRANGIDFYMSYSKQTRHLRIINSIINPRGKNGVFDFAKELFDTNMPDRYNWLRKKIKAARESGEISEKSFLIANRHLVDLSKGV